MEEKKLKISQILPSNLPQRPQFTPPMLKHPRLGPRSPSAAGGCWGAGGTRRSYWLPLARIKSRSGKFNADQLRTSCERPSDARAHWDEFSADSAACFRRGDENRRTNRGAPWRKGEIHNRSSWDVNWFLWETFNAEKPRCCKCWRRTVIQRYARAGLCFKNNDNTVALHCRWSSHQMIEIKKKWEEKTHRCVCCGESLRACALS